jgi:hypothetical protein
LEEPAFEKAIKGKQEYLYRNKYHQQTWLKKVIIDFENDCYVYDPARIVDSTSRSGQYCTLFNTIYGPIYRTTFAELNQHFSTLLVSKAYVKPLDKEKKLTGICILLSVNHNNEAYVYKYKGIESEQVECNKWNELSLDWRIYRPLSMSDTIEVYLYNPEQIDCLVDDFTIDFYK